MNLIELRIRIRTVAAHHEIGDNRGILCLNGQDVVTLDTDGVPHFDDEVRHRIMLFDDAHGRHGHRRGRDRDLMAEQHRKGRRGTAHGDITNLAQGILLNIGKHVAKLR